MALSLRLAGEARGPVSSLDPTCRLACLLLLSSASLIASWLLATVLALAFLVLLKLGGLRIPRILGESTFILLFAMATVVLHAFSDAGRNIGPGQFAQYSAVFCLKLIAAFLSGRLFYASSSTSEIRDAVSRITRYIPGLRRFDIGLGISLVLSYIPLIFEEWQDSLQAARSRGMPQLPNPRQLIRFISSFLRRLILRAVALPSALGARGYFIGRGLLPLNWRKRDSICLLCAGIIFIVALRTVLAVV
jgi:energy-coupling factor transporter transmembrane protein EcfT